MEQNVLCFLRKDSQVYSHFVPGGYGKRPQIVREVLFCYNKQNKGCTNRSDLPGNSMKKDVCGDQENLYPPIHEKTVTDYSFDRLDMLWERYPQYHEMSTFSTMDALLEEHTSWQEDYEDVREEYESKHYDRFLVQLSWADLPYRYAAKRLIEKADPSGRLGQFLQSESPDQSDSGMENPYVKAFMEQFTGIDTDRNACFLFPESFVSQFFVVMEVCKKAADLRPVRNLFPDEEKIHYLAVFDKRDMDTVLLMFHLLYTNGSGDLFGGYSLYDYPFLWYQTHLQEDGTVLRSPYLPDRLARYQGNLPFCHNPAKTVYVRRNIEHILEAGYFSSELEFFLSLTRTIMPFFQWWYTDLALYEEKDGYRTDWRLERTKIRTKLTADGIIRPKWKHELTLFHAVRKKYPDTLYQYRPAWLGRQSLDLYIPSLHTAIEYQGIQHFHPVDFFGGEEALLARQELDSQKKRLCGENNVRLIEWPYDLEPVDRNIEIYLGE